MTDWNSEADALGTSNFWKPESGSHKVTFKDDGEPSTYTDPKGRVTDQMNFEIEVGGEEKTWTVTKAKTVNSLFGQISLIGQQHGSLEGKTITLLVKFDKQNNKREYTIEEALPLIDEWNRNHDSKNLETGTEETPHGDSSDSIIEQKFQETEKQDRNKIF